MVPFPSVPTDSLYKFKALGGIFILFSSLILFIAEINSASREKFDLDKEIALYKLKIAIAAEDDKDSERIWRIDSLNNMKARQELRKRVAQAAKKNEDVHYTVNGKLYSVVEYEGLLIGYFNDAKSKHNDRVKIWNERQNERRRDEIRIRQKQDLKAWNDSFLDFISYVTGGAILLAAILIITGFEKWKTLQSLNDELTKLQVEKARKDVNGDKPKIIMPN